MLTKPPNMSSFKKQDFGVKPKRKMDYDVALKIFALGASFGNKRAKLGLDVTKASNEMLAQTLYDGFKEFQAEIDKYSKLLNAKQKQVEWYAQNFTCKQAFRFGAIAGFQEYPQTKETKGLRILTESAIDKLTQKQFRNTINE